MFNGTKRGVSDGKDRGAFRNATPINCGLFSLQERPSFYKINPLDVGGILAYFCPELEDVNFSSTTIQNLANNNIAEGTIESTAILDAEDDKKEVNFGTVTGRVNFGNRYKPVGGVTVISIMKNIDNTDTLQFIGGSGTTGFEGYYLGKNSTNQYVFRCGVGGAVLNQTTATILNNETIDKFRMYTGTYDSTTIKIYFNDELRRDGGNPLTGNISYVGITNGYWATIQGQTGNAVRYWNGEGRAYLVFNRALEHWEIEGIFNYFLDLKLVDRID